MTMHIDTSSPVDASDSTAELSGENPAENGAAGAPATVAGIDPSLAARTARLAAWVHNLPVPEFSTPWRKDGTIAHLPAAKLASLGIATNSEPWKLYRAEYNTRLAILECRVDVDLTTGAVKGEKKPRKNAAATEGGEGAPATEKVRRTPAELARDRVAELVTACAELATWVAEKGAHTPELASSETAELTAELGKVAASLAPHAELAAKLPAEWGIAKAGPKAPAYTPIIGDMVILHVDARPALQAIGATDEQLAAPGKVRTVIPTAKMVIVDFGGMPLPVPMGAIRKAV